MDIPEVKCTLLCGASDYSQSLLFEVGAYYFLVLHLHKFVYEVYEFH